MADSGQTPDDVPLSTSATNASTLPTGVPSVVPASLLDSSSVPENPFLPRWPWQQPLFLDTNACICALRNPPNGNASTSVWQCQGNASSPPITSTSGKWFNAANAAGNISTMLDDASNPPLTDDPLVLMGNSTLLPLASVDPHHLSVFDEACTGVNRTNFTTSYYRAKQELDTKQTPIDAAPCWRPGAIPIPLTQSSSWQNETGFFGCKQGFFCP